MNRTGPHWEWESDDDTTALRPRNREHERACFLLSAVAVLGVLEYVYLIPTLTRLLLRTP